MLLKVWLDQPRCPDHIATLFQVHKTCWNSSHDGRYEGAASMGINGYRFSFADNGNCATFKKAIRAAKIPCAVKVNKNQQVPS